jgi:hypothetical protein
MSQLKEGELRLNVTSTSLVVGREVRIGLDKVHPN